MKKWMMVFCFLLNFLLQINRLNAQQSVASSSVVPNLIPPTPEAFSFQRYGNNKINLSTGTIAYTIPLFNIKTGDFDLPLSVSYSSNGVKVDEVASRVGLQWKIDFGGAITRSIQGIPDEINNGGTKFNTNELTSLASYLAMRAMCNGPSNGAYMPDIYSYNAPGLSGKFYIHKKLNGGEDIIQIPHNNNKIELNINGGFRITNANGIEYYFGQSNAYDMMMAFSQITPNTGFSTSENSAKNAYYLTKIKLLNGKEIIYNYDNIGSGSSPISYISGVSQTYKSHAYCYPSHAELYNLNPVTNASLNEYSAALLKSIVFENGVIDFFYSDREDIIGEKKLDSARLSNNKSMSYTSKFYYMYSNYTATNYDSRNVFNQPTSYQNLFPELRKRLFLQAINNPNGNANASFSFEYNDINSLPPRLSFAQDYWGYFNGVENQKDLFFPAYTPHMWNCREGEEYGADRRANFESSKKGVLTKINYPTGGYTIYDYEAAGTFKSLKPIYDELNYSSNISPTNNIFSSSSFNVNNAIDIHKIEFIPSTVPYSFNPNGSNNYLPDTLITISIKNNLGDIVWQKIAGISQIVIDKRIRLINESLTYYIEVKSQYNQPINFQLKFYKKTNQQQPDGPANGIRVKELQDFDALGNFTGKRKFLYKWDNTLLSNTSFNWPNNRYGAFCSIEFDHAISNTSPNPLPYKFDIISSNSQFPLFNSEANSQFFEYVTDEIYDKNNNATGGTQTKFYFLPKSLPVGFDDLPLTDVSGDCITTIVEPMSPTYFDMNYINSSWLSGTPMTNTDLNNGKELQINTYVYNSTGNKVYKNMREFVYTVDSNAKAINCFVNIKSNLIDCNSYPPSNTQIWLRFFRLNKYYIISNWQHLDAVIDKSFDDNGNLLINNITYTYDNPLHMLPSTETRQNSKLELIRQRRTYNSDLLSYPIYQNMKNKNILTSPVLIIDSNLTKNQFLAHLRTEYNTFNNIFKAQNIYKKIGAATEKLAVNFSSYDNFGNITTIQKPNDIPECFIWGYGGQYPVAKIVGTTFSTANAVLSSADLAIINNPATTDIQMRNVLNNLRTSLPNTFVTTYTYKPLVGITSETDPNNKTKYYEYDSFNRLKLIKDFNGNILKTFDYKYKQTY